MRAATTTGSEVVPLGAATVCASLNCLWKGLPGSVVPDEAGTDFVSVPITLLFS